MNPFIVFLVYSGIFILGCFIGGISVAMYLSYELKCINRDISAKRKIKQDFDIDI